MDRKEREKIAQELIDIISAFLRNDLDFAYLSPSCSECHFPLSDYMASSKLICLKCGSVFEPKLVGVEKT